MNKVYLAGPITSLSYDEANDWRAWFKNEITKSDKIQCLSPMRGKHYLKDCKDISATGNEKLGILSGGPAILTRDHSDVVNSDIIVVNLLGATKVSIGCMFEIAWAYHKHIPIVLIIEDDVINIHSHSMLFAMCGYRVNNLFSALTIVKAFFDVNY
jgi:nucleoside 2-deoxyribosyltransferase